MEIVTFFSDATGASAATGEPIGDFRLINGAIPIHIYGDNIDAVIEIQGTIATQSEVNDGTCTWTTINNGKFYTDTYTALFCPVTHVRANVTSYTSGTYNVKIMK